jgi:hypothetical protein
MSRRDDQDRAPEGTEDEADAPGADAIGAGLAASVMARLAAEVAEDPPLDARLVAPLHAARTHALRDWDAAAFTDAVMARVATVAGEVEALDTAAAALLRADVEAEVASRDFSRFSPALSSESPPLADALVTALRAERDAAIASRDFSLFSPSLSLDSPPLADALVTALRAERDAAIASRDFSRFTPALSSLSLDSPPLADALVTALRAERDAAIASRDFAALTPSILRACEALADSEPERTAIGAVVAADVATEVASRSGAWVAFGEGIRRELGLRARQDARLPADERAIRELREDVAAELDQVQPRFESEFREEVEDRIAEPAPAGLAAFWARLSGWMDELGAGVRLGLAGAAVAAAAILMIVFAPANVPTDPERPRIEPGPPMARVGEVTIDHVAFEGTVTLSQDEGVAVIWLADAS